ncbi:MAG: hypothetical protein K6G90_01545, partial [Clostridia bacterium]|nr:hypothetical protein [Clostridia bacterium]
MKKTGWIRFLCLGICVMMAVGAIGAGKPAAVRTDAAEQALKLPEVENIDAVAAPRETDGTAGAEDDSGEDPFDADAPAAVDPADGEEPVDPEEPADQEEPTELPEAIDPIDETTDDALRAWTGVYTGKLKSGHDSTTTVSFSVDFSNFFGDNTVYHKELASFSVLGAALAYYDPNYQNAYFTFDQTQTVNGTSYKKVDGMQMLEMFGFEDIVDYSLDTDTDYSDDDLCEVLIGHRTVTQDDETKIIIAIWVRGTENKSLEEWSSNFHMGDLVRFFDEYDSVASKSPRQKNDDWTRKTNHRGFDVCATRLLNYLKTYYLDEYVQPELDANPEASLTYWITGHSRGAAVGNLMASYLVDEGKTVFAYTFATPSNTANTEASAEKYDCIFNLVNANDFVPMLPMPEWGFTRYGRTCSIDTDTSEYQSLIKTATGLTYAGKYLTASDREELIGKFIPFTEDPDTNTILGWRDVYVYHCGHAHTGETVADDYQAKTIVSGQSNSGYADRLQKYSYTYNNGICETAAYPLQVLVELMSAINNKSTLSLAAYYTITYLGSQKLAEKFDYGKNMVWNYKDKLVEAHLMDTYSVIQAQINTNDNPGNLFVTLPYYANNGRPVHTHTYTYVPYEGHEPTCTEEGLGYRYCLCSETDADFYDDYQKNVPIPALGHDWGEAVYGEWIKTENSYSITASRSCQREGCNECETETAIASAAVTKEPTCTEKGKTTYTAAFENDAFETQVQTLVDVDALGHDWGAPVYTWTETENGYTVKAEHSCQRTGCGTTEDETVTAVYAVVTEPSVSADGLGRYTATFTNAAFSTQTYDFVLPRIVPKFKSQSLTLSGEIGINFFIEFPEGIEPEGSYMLFTVGNSTTEERADFNSSFTNASGKYG